MNETQSPIDIEIRRIGGLLASAGIVHALIGGLAVGFHGYPRATGDMDLLIDEQAREPLIALLQTIGYSVAFQTPDALHFAGPIGLDVLLARREPTRRMLADALPAGPGNIPVVRVEDVIGLKIQAYSNNGKRQWHDQADIAELIRCNPALDWSKVLSYAALFQETATLERIRASVLG